MSNDDPATLSSNPSIPVRAGKAFAEKFKREPASPSDSAWLNGYAESLTEIERLTRGMNAQADVMVAREREFAAALKRLDELERANVGLATESDRLRAQLSKALLPCPICHGVEGCDHTVSERFAAHEALSGDGGASETTEPVHKFTGKREDPCTLCGHNAWSHACPPTNNGPLGSRRVESSQKASGESHGG